MEEALKFKLTIAYDGSSYAGWQIQKSGVTVQEKVEEAVASLFQVHCRVHSSSRTDTGVHARAMVAHFEVPRAKFRMSLAKLPLAINAKLPPDIRVMTAKQVGSDFHARFDARGKQYRYFVYNYHALDPLLRHTAWHVPKPLDLGEMQKALTHFVGKQDFAAFANNRNYEMESTIRTITRCDLKRSGPHLTFIIEGDGFLYKMCRGIVGTVIQVGQGKFSPAAIRQMLKAKDRQMAGMTAPAHGLILWKVFY